MTGKIMYFCSTPPSTPSAMWRPCSDVRQALSFRRSSWLVEAFTRARAAIDNPLLSEVVPSSKPEFYAQLKRSVETSTATWERERDSCAVVMLVGTATLNRPKLGCWWFCHSSMVGD